MVMGRTTLFASMFHSTACRCNDSEWVSGPRHCGCVHAGLEACITACLILVLSLLRTVYPGTRYEWASSHPTLTLLGYRMRLRIGICLLPFLPEVGVAKVSPACHEGPPSQRVRSLGSLCLVWQLRCRGVDGVFAQLKAGDVLRRKWALGLENRVLRSGVALLIVEDVGESSRTLTGCVAPICLSLGSRGVSLDCTHVGVCFSRVQRCYR